MTGRKGPPCSVCKHPRISEIDADARAYPIVAKRFQIAPTTMQRHRVHRNREAEVRMKEVAEVKRSFDDGPAAVLDALEDGHARLVQMMSRASVDDIPRYVTSLEKLRKQIEVTKKAAELTDEQIVKSAAWKALLERIEVAMKPYPEACRALAKALSEVA